MATDFSELLALFREGPRCIKGALGDTMPSATPSAGDDWSLSEVLLHVADAELVRAVRIRLILATEKPPLFDFDQDVWRSRLQYERRDAAGALRLYAECVDATADLLVSAGDEAWARAGTHPVDGPLSVTTLIERGIQHAAEHADQVARMAG